MNDKPPFEWANYDGYLSTDYELLLAAMKSGMAIVALINDEDSVRVVQGVFYNGSVDFRTQGVSYLYLFEDQLNYFGEWCTKKGIRWFVPCNEPAPTSELGKVCKHGQLARECFHCDLNEPDWHDGLRVAASVHDMADEVTQLRAEVAELKFRLDGNALELDLRVNADLTNTVIAENEWMGECLNAVADAVKPVSLPEEVNGFEDIPKVIARLSARVAELEKQNQKGN